MGQVSGQPSRYQPAQLEPNNNLNGLQPIESGQFPVPLKHFFQVYRRT